MTGQRIDLGDDHFLTFESWSPDRSLNPLYEGVPDVERYGALIEHPNRTGGSRQHVGGITFAGEVQRLVHPGVTTWDVQSWDPLTITPSILCSCGDHGFITDGRWVGA